MKALFVALQFFFMFNVSALPVVNVNIAPPGSGLVIWKDHESKSLVYILPKGFTVEENYHWGYKVKLKTNEMMISFKRKYDRDSMYKAMDGYYKDQQYFVYTDVKFEDQQLNMGTILDDFFDEKKCWDYTDTFIAHLEFDDDAFYFHCTFKLNENGRTKLIPFLDQGKTIALNATFKVKGVVELSNGSFKEVIMPIGLPVFMKRPDKVIDWP